MPPYRPVAAMMVLALGLTLCSCKSQQANTGSLNRDSVLAKPDTKGVYIPREPTARDLEALRTARVIDCNDNNVADSLDIVHGVLHDRNGNGYPDECEPDSTSH